MKSGYKILWTDFALKLLEEIVQFLEEPCSEAELKN